MTNIDLTIDQVDQITIQALKDTIEDSGTECHVQKAAKIVLRDWFLSPAEYMEYNYVDPEGVIRENLE